MNIPLFWIVVQFLIGINLINPLLLLIFRIFVKREIYKPGSIKEFDYAIIVTAYKQVDLLPSVVDSILQLNYNNFLVYVVADNCDISSLVFSDKRVILLKPEETLSSNIKSHLYAIDNFKRVHELITIIDSDNLVDSEYLNHLNVFFAEDFEAVQGVRKAKNLNTKYACLDEAGDMFYRFIDRKLLFDLGSSASLAGSGMAFTAVLYKECLDSLNITGAGFDKLLQTEILSRKKRIAFAEQAFVYDEKTSNPTQLVNQRARWINAWFKFAWRGVTLAGTGLINLNWNQFICGIMFCKPPIFITVGLTGLSILIDIFVMPTMLFFWMFAILSFFTVFFYSLSYFNATKQIYSALTGIPIFIFYQVISLFKAKDANKLSTSTVHSYVRDIDHIKRLEQ
jgi:cellulose synthase/poly-beta-1,6-N-acetylglucosamine synthase-like glycosyltransferase